MVERRPTSARDEKKHLTQGLRKNSQSLEDVQARYTSKNTVWNITVGDGGDLIGDGGDLLGDGGDLLGDGGNLLGDVG